MFKSKEGYKLRIWIHTPHVFHAFRTKPYWTSKAYILLQACFLIPLGVVIYVVVGGMRSTLLCD